MGAVARDPYRFSLRVPFECSRPTNVGSSTVVQFGVYVLLVLLLLSMIAHQSEGGPPFDVEKRANGLPICQELVE